MKNVVSFATLVAAVFAFSAVAWAQQLTFTNVSTQIRDARDIEAVRTVVLREIEGCLKGDAAQVLSCYDADNLMFCTAGGNPDPKTWTIWGAGRDYLQAYVEYNVNNAKTISKNPDYRHTAEIQHVDVKGNFAIAVAKHHTVSPNKEKGKVTTRDLESAFFLKKNAKGEWKIIGGVGGTTSKREVTDLVTP